MIGTCQNCGSRNVRRSKRLAQEMTWRRNFFAPYYCRDCKRRFLAVSTNTYYLGALVGLAIVVGVIGWYVITVLSYPRPAPELLAEPVMKDISETVKRAEKDDPQAEYALAQTYARGDGVPRNEVESRTWLERAAQHGSPEAQYEIGMANRDGRGVVQDYDAAFKWLQLAAENGNARAQFEFGYMYRLGMGMPVDNAKAYVWFNLAAAHGNTDAVQARDAVLPLLSRSEVVEAQTEARRRNTESAKPAATR
jgi:uncharacterized protein